MSQRLGRRLPCKPSYLAYFRAYIKRRRSSKLGASLTKPADLHPARRPPVSEKKCPRIVLQRVRTYLLNQTKVSY